MADARSKFLLRGWKPLVNNSRHETGVEFEHEPFRTAFSFNSVRSAAHDSLIN